MTSKDTLPPSSSSGVLTPPSSTEARDWNDEDVEKRMEKDGNRNDALSRTRSAVSIAETMSLPKEIAFVSVICMANFMTRWFSLYVKFIEAKANKM